MPGRSSIPPRSADRRLPDDAVETADSGRSSSNLASIMKYGVSLLFAFLIAWNTSAAAPLGPRIGISVSAVSAGSESPNKSTRISERQLKIRVENGENMEFKDLELRWSVIRKDIRSGKLSLAGSGKKTISLEPISEKEFTSSVVKFTENEGKAIPKPKGKSNNKGKKKPPVYGPDTGTAYAGYVVEIRRGSEILAEASTNGIRGHVAGIEKLP